MPHMSTLKNLSRNAQNLIAFSLLEPGAILRILNVCRENKIMNSNVVIDFARHVANGVIDNTFIDQFENSCNLNSISIRKRISFTMIPPVYDMSLNQFCNFFIWD